MPWERTWMNPQSQRCSKRSDNMSEDGFFIHPQDGPCIWYGHPGYVKRLDDYNHVGDLQGLPKRDLRIMKAVLETAMEHVDIAFKSFEE